MLNYSALEQFDILKVFGASQVGYITNISIFTIVVVAWGLSYSALGSTSSSYRTIVNYKFFFVNYVYSFIKNLTKENLTMEKNIFFYFLLSLMSFLLISNLVGLLPYALTLTSYIAITLFFSCTGFFANILVGLRTHRSHFFSLFIPTGTPAILKPALVFIELVSYVARLFSLAIRLFANMMAGHALLKILSGFGFAFLTSFFATGLASLVVLMVVWAVTVLELLIAFLQGYVFVVLSMIYLNETVNLH
jgi:F-type H+-transporting ATPase subunit a